MRRQLLALALVLAVAASTLAVLHASASEVSVAVQANNTVGVFRTIAIGILSSPNNTLRVACGSNDLVSLVYEVNLSAVNATFSNLVTARAFLSYNGEIVEGELNANLTGIGGLLGLTRLNQSYTLLIDRNTSKAHVASSLSAADMFGSSITLEAQGSGATQGSIAVVEGTMSAVLTGAYAGLIANESSVLSLLKLVLLSPNVSVVNENVSRSENNGARTARIDVEFRAYYPIEQNTTQISVNETARLGDNNTILVRAVAVVRTGEISSLASITSLLAQTTFKLNSTMIGSILSKISVTPKTRVYLEVNSTSIYLEASNVKYAGSIEELAREIAEGLVGLGASPSQKVVLACNGTTQIYSLGELAGNNTIAKNGSSESRGASQQNTGQGTGAFKTTNSETSGSNRVPLESNPSRTKSVVAIIAVLVLAVAIIYFAKGGKTR